MYFCFCLQIILPKLYFYVFCISYICVVCWLLLATMMSLLKHKKAEVNKITKQMIENHDSVVKSVEKFPVTVEKKNMT